MFDILKRLFSNNGLSHRRKIIAVDCETTGLDARLGHRIVSLALVEADSDLAAAGGSYLVFNPERKCDPKAERAHGLNGWYLKHQPLIGAHLTDIAEQIEGALLVGHNLPFDLSFLCAEFEAAGVEIPRYDACCTMALAEGRFGKRLSLESALRAFDANLDLFRQDGIHNAFDDACMTLALYALLTRNGEVRLRKFAAQPDNERPAPDVTGPEDMSRKAMIERGRAISPQDAFDAYHHYNSGQIAAKALGVSRTALMKKVGEYNLAEGEKKLAAYRKAKAERGRNSSY